MDEPARRGEDVASLMSASLTGVVCKEAASVSLMGLLTGSIVVLQWSWQKRPASRLRKKTASREVSPCAVIWPSVISSLVAAAAQPKKAAT